MCLSNTRPLQELFVFMTLLTSLTACLNLLPDMVLLKQIYGTKSGSSCSTSSSLVVGVTAGIYVISPGTAITATEPTVMI